MDTEDTGLPKEVRSALVLIVAAIVVAAVMLAINFQISRAIVDQAENFRKEMRHGRGQHIGPQAPDRVSGLVADLPGGGDVDGPGPAAPENGTAAEAVPVVRPGDESARPPHRGRVDGA